ncbi:hypothetical protein J7M23_06080 [Candidatus Sumerlaeota bacterium]|nr:hypothetical protein [Candidatus Sumerlaeota bacterium]
MKERKQNNKLQRAEMIMLFILMICLPLYLLRGDVYAETPSPTLSYAPPVLSDLPDIYIGDKEDWIATIDTNFFRFPDAFNLDDYVSDADTTVSELVWSFWEGDATSTLEINGILQLTSPPEALNADVLGKDIRHPSAPGYQPGNLVDFWDIKDSPKGSGPPWSSPAEPLVKTVTFFVSDGTYVDSQQILVRAVDNAYDFLPPPPGRPDIYEDDDTTHSASIAVVNWIGPPQHNFHDYADKDWARFFAIAPYPYTIRTKDLAPNCDAVIYFYRDGLAKPPLIRDDWGAGETETIYWQCLTSGTYYLRIENYDPSVYGEATSYTLEITADIGANNGIATALCSCATQILWNPDNVPTGTIGFNVWRIEAFSKDGFIQINPTLLPGSVFDYVDEGVLPASDYIYYVEAVDSSHQHFQYTSNLYAITPSSDEKKGPTIKPEPVYTTGHTNTIEWDAVAGATEYLLQYSDNYLFYPSLGDSGWIPDTCYTVPNLEYGKRYYYRVKWRDDPYDAEGSSWSKVVYSIQRNVSGVQDWTLY